LLDATLNQARRLAAIGGFSNPAGFPAHRYEDMEAEFLSRMSEQVSVASIVAKDPAVTTS
jgi:hypothetical protein